MKENLEQYDWYKPYLSADEYVRWTGRPERKISFQPVYLLYLPFCIVWCSAVIIATAGSLIAAFAGEGSPFVLFFMIPFWAAGSFMVYVFFVRPRRYRKYAVYAITNQKVIEKYRGRINIVNIDPTPLVQMSVSKRSGFGSISVAGSLQTWYDQDNFTGNTITIIITNIKDPEKVYKLIVNKDAD